MGLNRIELTEVEESLKLGMLFQDVFHLKDKCYF